MCAFFRRERKFNNRQRQRALLGERNSFSGIFCKLAQRIKEPVVPNERFLGQPDRAIKGAGGVLVGHPHGKP
jgi:hypothetical protein